MKRSDDINLHSKPRTILRDAVSVAIKAGLWKQLTLDEKKSLVRYFYSCLDRRKEVVW